MTNCSVTPVDSQIQNVTELSCPTAHGTREHPCTEPAELVTVAAIGPTPQGTVGRLSTGGLGFRLELGAFEEGPSGTVL